MEVEVEADGLKDEALDGDELGAVSVQCLCEAVVRTARG